MYVIGFNGPPYCGKDTLARLLREHIEREGRTHIPVIEMSLSMPLRKLAYQMVGLRYMFEEGKGLIPSYATFKETHFDQFGTTGRQLMIDVSEKFLKPCYGQEVMARMLIESFPKINSLILIRDCGFQCEVDPLIREVGSGNFLVTRIYRPGTTFDGDSRERVYHPMQTMNRVIQNDGDLDNLRTEAVALYERVVIDKGWKL